MASPITSEQFIRSTQNELSNPMDGCAERIAIDLGVRPSQIVIEGKGTSLRFTLVQPGSRAIHLDYFHPNHRPKVQE